MVNADVIVVGAGLAGLTAARDLADRDRDVLVLEARDRLGGRTYSRPWADHPELGAEVGGAYVNLRDEHNLRREIERYDIAVSSAAGSVTGARFVVHGAVTGNLPVPVTELVDIERVTVRLAEDARRISPTVPLIEQHLVDLDVSIKDYLDRLELPAATGDLACGVIAGWIQCDPAETSILQVLIAILSCGGSPFDTFFGTLAGSTTFSEGTAQLLEAMVAGSAMRVELSRTVVRVEHDADEVTVHLGDGTRRTARECVVAVPAWTLGSLAFSPPLAQAKQDMLHRSHGVRGVKKLILIDGAPSGVIGIGGISAPFQWLIPDRTLPDGRTVMVGFSVRQVLATNDLGAIAEAVAPFFPEATVVSVDGEDWYADPLTRGIVGFCPPGDARAFAHTMNRPEGRVCFAGAELTNTVTFWGWMDGAVQSGHEAALHVASRRPARVLTPVG